MLAKYFVPHIPKRLPHSHTTPKTSRRSASTSSSMVSHARYQPPILLSECQDIERSGERGRHEMWKGYYKPWGKTCFIKDISEFTLATQIQRWQGQGASVPYEEVVTDARDLARRLTQREVFITRLVGHMAPHQAPEHVAVAVSNYSLDDGSLLPYGENYYVMSSAIPNFEPFSQVPDLENRFSVNPETGYTLFNHPTEGPQEVTGRIMLKIVLRLLGETDANLENLALGPKNEKGQRRYVSIDHELCSMQLPESKDNLVKELTDGTVGTIFPGMDLSGLAIKRRKEVKEEAVLHLDRLCNTPEGQMIVKNIIVETFSHHYGKSLERDIYQPLRDISEVIADAANIIRARRCVENIGWQAKIIAEQATSPGIKL